MTAGAERFAPVAASVVAGAGRPTDPADGNDCPLLATRHLARKIRKPLRKHAGDV